MTYKPLFKCSSCDVPPTRIEIDDTESWVCISCEGKNQAPIIRPAKRARGGISSDHSQVIDLITL
jgi:hypothetical protein